MRTPRVGRLPVLVLFLSLAAVLVQAASAAGPRPRNTEPPVLSGTAQVGSTLTTTTGTWVGDEPMSFTYAWQRCNASGRSCVEIAGESAQTYTLTPADEGSAIRSVVTATNPRASKSADSDPTAPVAPKPPPPLSVTKSGAWAAEGLVKSQRAGVDDGRIICGADCVDDDNSAGRLVVEPYEYARWNGWSGACGGLLLACEFSGASGPVAANASFAADGRTPATCDGAAGAAVSPLTATSTIGYDVDWQSSTRLGYNVFRGSQSPVLLLDRDGSCGLGSTTERLFYRSSDTTPVLRYHQPGNVIAPDTHEWSFGHGRFAFSPDGSKIAYAVRGFVHVADATTGANAERLGYQDANNWVVMQYSGKPSWSPDGTKIAFHGIETRNNVQNGNKDLIVVYPGQGSRWTALDIYGGVCSVWRSNETLYAQPILKPGTSELNDQLGAVDMSGNVSIFGRHGAYSCPTSRSSDGKIALATTADPAYAIVADADNTSTLASWHSPGRNAPTLSPDGSKVAWLEIDPTLTFYEIVAADANGGPLARLLPSDTGVFDWSPTGDLLAVGPNQSGERQLKLVAPTTQPAPLLERFAPELRYDAQEAYRADSVATIVDNFTPQYTNRLRDFSGATLAASDPADPADTLSLDYLRPVYPSGTAASSMDYVDENDGSRVADAQRLHANHAYANRIYGREVPVADGGKLLQYWFFYYDNPKTFFTVGNHEGDWEMVQVRLDAAGEPVGATFSQHKGGEYCAWDRVQHASNGRPIVYVAHESHASYFTPGDHPVAGGLGIEYDYADGNGESVVPAVVDVTTVPEWMKWPGHFGGTFVYYPDGRKTESPRSPYQQSHWNAEAFESGAAPCTVGGLTTFKKTDATRRIRASAPQAPPAPRIEARRVGRNVVIDYRVPRSRTEPWLLVTTVDGVRDRYTPTNERTYLRGKLRGRIVQPVLLSRGPLRVLASVRAANGARSTTVSVRVR